MSYHKRRWFTRVLVGGDQMGKQKGKMTNDTTFDTLVTGDTSISCKISSLDTTWGALEEGLCGLDGSCIE